MSLAADAYDRLWHEAALWLSILGMAGS